MYASQDSKKRKTAASQASKTSQDAFQTESKLTLASRVDDGPMTRSKDTEDHNASASDEDDRQDSPGPSETLSGSEEEDR